MNKLGDLIKGREYFHHLQVMTVVFREAYTGQKPDKNKEWKPLPCSEGLHRCQN